MSDNPVNPPATGENLPVETVSASDLFPPENSTGFSKSEIAETTQLPAADPMAGKKDSKGISFDPEKHRPKFFESGKRKGQWIPKNIGAPPRAPGSNGQTPSVSEIPTDASPQATAPSVPAGPDKYDMAADVYCRAFYGTADMTIGGNGEWNPDSEAEHEQLKTALAAYLRHKQAEDLPPGWGLALVASVYCFKRIRKPNTKEKLAYLFVYWRDKVRGMLGKKRLPSAVS